jgi:hypothetical protein
MIGLTTGCSAWVVLPFGVQQANTSIHQPNSTRSVDFFMVSIVCVVPRLHPGRLTEAALMVRVRIFPIQSYEKKRNFARVDMIFPTKNTFFLQNSMNFGVLVYLLRRKFANVKKKMYLCIRKSKIDKKQMIEIPYAYEQESIFSSNDSHADVRCGRCADAGGGGTGRGCVV